MAAAVVTVSAAAVVAVSSMGRQPSDITARPSPALTTPAGAAAGAECAAIAGAYEAWNGAPVEPPSTIEEIDDLNEADMTVLVEAGEAFSDAADGYAGAPPATLATAVDAYLAQLAVAAERVRTAGRVDRGAAAVLAQRTIGVRSAYATYRVDRGCAEPRPPSTP